MGTTRAALNRYAAGQAAAVERWAREGLRIASGKLSDARAHAGKALTETLRETPSGRPTVLATKRSRSYLAAVARVDEMAEGLAAFLADARERLLVDAFDAWAPMLGVPARKPNQRERAATRSAALHGYTLQDEIRPRADRIKRAMGAAIAQAAAPDLPARDAAAILNAWERRSAVAIASGLRLLLSDSAILADNVAVWFLLPADERPDKTEPPIPI